MRRITSANVKTPSVSILRLMKDAKVSGEVDGVDVRTPVSWKGGKVGGLQFKFDQALLDYSHEQKHIRIRLINTLQSMSKRFESHVNVSAKG